VTYHLSMHKEAARVLDRLDRQTADRIRERLRDLQLYPFDLRLSKPLKTKTGLRSSRVGDWRIIYTVRESEKVIQILSVAPRGKAYRS